LIETGPFGTLLDRLLFEANIKHFVVTNAVICAPFTDEQKSRTRNPIPEEISACSPNLTLLLQKLEPPAIMLFGKEAVKSYELIMKKHPTKTPMFKFPSLFNIRSANTVEYRRVYLQLLEVRNAIGL
jgi:uracil-DNA glycosylase